MLSASDALQVNKIIYIYIREFLMFLRGKHIHNPLGLNQFILFNVYYCVVISIVSIPTKYGLIYPVNKTYFIIQWWRVIHISTLILKI